MQKWVYTIYYQKETQRKKKENDKYKTRNRYDHGGNSPQNS